MERSVTIAGISTRELVLKDYVTEQSDDKLRQAGRLMSQKLAGSLAQVTCKEPLRGNLASHLRIFLQEFGFNEVRLITFTRPLSDANVSLCSKSSLRRS